MIKNEKQEIVLEKINNGTWNEQEILNSCSMGLISSKDLPNELKNDREFAIEYAKEMYCFFRENDSLRYFSEKIRSDKDVVFAFLDKRSNAAHRHTCLQSSK